MATAITATGDPIATATNKRRGHRSGPAERYFAGPGFFMRSHEATPYAWTDGMLGPRKDTISIIDKESLAIARTITPAPGKTAAHVEFDRHGRYALVSIWENDGALIVYDASTFQEVKRMPMSRPSGKYNVWNKINFSDGTSH